ncbi:MAG: ATP-dependent DNA helicase RecG, partial [Candidatus Woesebacteria bacterium GW2011_GWB1_38_8b]
TGDVGSGKTVVAAYAMFSAFVNGFQSVIMAPTQILASQHYKTLNEIFKNLNVRISLLTGHEKKVAIGKSDIFVGTHALLHTKINFSDVALVVIDEQHRFGVEQRTHLIKSSGKRNAIPHILTMTATPIPRTIAMSLYGDLDLSVLTEMPKGRIPVTTWIVPPEKRSGGYDWIKDKIEKEKTQVYIIWESESDLLKEVKSAKLEYQNIKKIFPQFRIGLLHGKLKPIEKESAINDFKEGKIDILVSTAVVEVGIDVANAGIIVIEAAERFGLAQLHQLRGRVGRGNTKSYCLLFTQSRSDKTVSRLKVLKENHSGFTLAEMDLKMRGPGEVFGTMQSGFSNLKVARWSDIELIKKAKQVAEKIQLSPELYIQVLDYYFGSDSPLN